jgi:conjugative transposon TraN protein
MKNLIIATLLIVCAHFVSAQNNHPTIIEPLNLDITHQKTTNLIFSREIISVDKGSRSILAQKAKGAGHILQIKAAGENFQQTNLTVVTSDGSLYSFILDYASAPKNLNLVFGSSPLTGSALSDCRPNQALVEVSASEVAGFAKTIKGKKQAKFGISIALEGLYVHQDLLYYQLKLQNKTHVSYDIAQLRFFIYDQNTSKRTANQQLELLPQYIHGNTNKIDAGSERVIVFAIPKHTIPDQKKLLIELMENNGGRHLALNIKNKTIIRALPFEPAALP